MKISDEERKKNREEYKQRSKFSYKMKEFYSIYLSSITRYIKNRGGWLILHLIISIIALIDGSKEAFGLMYVCSVIFYEGYVYSLREKLEMNKG